MFKLKPVLQDVDFDYLDLPSGGGGGSFDDKEKKKRKKKQDSGYKSSSDSHEPIDNSAVTTMLFTTIL